MFNVNSISLKNFGSHSSTEFDVKSGNVTIVNGKNLTDLGQESNGSGKSFFIEAFVFAITGTPFRKATAEELILEGEKESEVEVRLRRGEENYTFNRKIFKKKSSVVQIFKNGEEIVCPSVLDTNQKILDIIGLSKQDLVDYFLISKEKYTSFFSSSDTAKKDLINRFSKANLIDSVEVEVKSDFDSSASELVKKEHEIEKINVSIESYKDSLNSSNDSIEDLKKKDLESLSELKKDVLSEKVKYKANQSKIKSFQKQIDEFDVPNIEDEKVPLEKELIKLKNELGELEELKKEMKFLKSECNENIADLEKKLSGVIECPKCEHEFSVSEKDFNPEKAFEKISDLQANLNEIKETIQENEKSIETNHENQRFIKDEIASISSIVREKESELNELKSELRGIERENVNIEKLIAQYEREIERLNSKTYESKDAIIQERIESAKEKLKLEEENLEKIKIKNQEYNKWLATFKRFKGHLANSSLGSIEGYTNLYLEKLKSNIRVKFDGYKELKGGKIKEKIEVSILKDGVESGSFGKLSSGEKARIEVSTILAINNLVNLSTEGGGINIAILDEVLESLDGIGLDSIVEALQELGQTIILITHGAVNTNKAEQITVVKENGISYIA